MTEAWLPIPPDPDPNPYWDPTPGRCPVCRTILQNVHPASRGDQQLEGWCPEHGNVTPVYEGSR